MRNVVPISRQGTVALPKALREEYGMETPGKMEVVPEEGGLKIRPVSSFMKKFGAAKHQGKLLDFRSLRKEFEGEISGRKGV